MDSSQISKKLKSLIQLDIDAMHAYTHAIERVTEQEIKDQLTQFRNDHLRHVETLSSFIKSYGEEAPRYSQDFKGYVIEGFTALRSITGTEGALKAMKMNEELTNKTYEAALSWDMPTDVREEVTHNREDERIHLQYIERAIRERLWEKSEKAA